MSTQSQGAPSEHRVLFVTPSGVDVFGDTITLTFGSSGSFNLSSITPNDVDLAVDVSAPIGDCAGSFAQKTLAASEAAGIWGVAVSGQQLSFTPPTNVAAGEIPVGACVRATIGTDAIFQATGTHEITNPVAPVVYKIALTGGFGDTGEFSFNILPTSGVTVLAKVGSDDEGGFGGPNPPDAPIIKNVHVMHIGETSADVLWDTDIASTSIVEYGLTASYGQQATITGHTFNHVVPLAGLQKATTYHFRVISAGVGTSTATSGDLTFTTIDTTPPVISNVQAIAITGTTARITWDTDEDSNSSVAYAISNPLTGTAVNGTMTNAHVVDLAGLTPDTLYHYTATSKDASGNAVTSFEYAFRTADKIPPMITNVVADQITQTSARVTWVTNELSDSEVLYGVTNAYGLTAASGPLVSNHQVSLADLISGMTYHFQVRSRDAAGNAASSTDMTFRTLPDTTPPANVAGLTVTPSDRHDTLRWTDSTDRDFVGVKIIRKTGGYPNNTTDGAQIYDGPGTSFDDTGLTNGTTYYYAVFAYDASGNFASGALGKGTPFAGVPPVTPPVTPLVTAGALDASKVLYFAMYRTIELGSDAAGAHEILGGATLSLVVPDTAFGKTPVSVTLDFGGRYRFDHVATSKMWSVDVQTPSEPQTMRGSVTVVYQDGSGDATDFTIMIRPHGIVTERLPGHAATVGGATVTLYQKSGDAWIQWDVTSYFQTNPQTTDGDGRYGFMTPNGTYELRIVKPGYRDRTVGPFVISDGIVAQDIEIIRIPEIVAGLPETGLVAQVPYIINIVSTEVLGNPIVRSVMLLFALLATLMALLAAATATALAAFLCCLRRMFLLPFLLFAKRGNLRGVVYDAVTKIPVDLAVVRLLRADGARARTFVTGKDGRYVFAAAPGEYRIEIGKQGMTFPSTRSAATEDGVYRNLYHGGMIAVAGGDVFIDVPMDPNGLTASARELILLHLLRHLQHVTILLALAVTLFALIAYRSWLLVGLIVIQFICLYFFRRLAWPMHTKDWGIVRDGATGKPLRFAVTRLHEDGRGTALDAKVTDIKGRYGFHVGGTRYGLSAEKPGYQKTAITPVDLGGLKKGESPKDIDISIKPKSEPPP